MKLLVSLLISLGMIMAPEKSEIKKVEPPCWWVGMETPLTLMVYGTQLAGCDVTVDCPDITVAAVHKAESPNYLFVDLKIASNLQPGEYTFTVAPAKGKKMTFKYSFNARREGSASRLSFGPKDVIYLLVADRFANGDPSNDSMPTTAEKANRDNIGGRHGGDLKGIMDHLDYLADYGITTIWPIPILLDNEKDYSYHGYACSDYYMVDPRYGTNELYKELVATAHSKGLKFIQDLVVNHCGTAHWWMDDLPFYDWITHFDKYTGSNWAMSTHSDPHASKADKDLCVQGWFDHTMADMNMANPYLMQYYTQWAIWWVEYANLDGLRVDTFPYTEKHLISQWTGNILREYPNLTIVGECWFHEPIEIAYWEGGKVSMNGEADPQWTVRNADGFTSHLPMVMDFKLQDQLYSCFNHNEKRPQGDQAGVRRLYDALSLDNVYVNPYNLMVFASNHDTNRPALLLGANRENEQKVLSRMKNMYTFILTTRGMPQLYYGDEIMYRSVDGTTGHSQERGDFPGGWSSDPANAFTAAGRTPEQDAMFNHARTLLNWRKGSKAVTEGKLTHFLPYSNPNTYVYFRYAGNDLVMVIINNSVAAVDIDWSLYREILGDSDGRIGLDILSGSKVKVGAPLRVAGETSMVLQF